MNINIVVGLCAVLVLAACGPAATPLPPSATPTATAIPPTNTPVPTAIHTAVAPPSPTSGPGIGATEVTRADGMVMVYVPPGNFLMGSADSDPNALPEEKPQHTVQLDAFWIDRTDVTNAMFAIFVQATGHKTDAERLGDGVVCVNGDCGTTNGADWQHPKGPSSNLDGRSSHPVVQVSWNDASSYCAWAGRRLPSEAEWEKAARGTDGRLYPWGNDAPNKTLLNYNQIVSDTTPVGNYPQGASPYGALDMTGNVWQWVADWYADGYYGQSPSSNPHGPASGQNRVARGGTWYYGAQYARVANRFNGDPGNRFGDGGFRCAR